MTAHSLAIDIVQISDTHFGTEIPEVTQNLINTINGIRPQVLIHSGDITQRAKTRQFAAARHFIDQLTFEHLLATPGNHDMPLYNVFSRFTRPYKHYNRWFGALPSQLIMEPVAVLSLNSCNIRHYKNGKFTEAALEQAEQFFARVPTDFFKIAVAHHPVDALLPSDEANIAEHSHHAVRRLQNAGVKLLMGGHIHCQFLQPLNDRYPDLTQRIWVSQAGTATSARTRGGLSNSFTHIQLDKETAVATAQIWDYDKNHQQFTPRDQLTLR